MQNNIFSLLKLAREKGASDLYIGEKVPIYLRIEGEIEKFEEPAFNTIEAEELIKEIIPEDKLIEWEKGKDLDFSLHLEEESYRVNIYRDRKGIQATFRIIPSRIPTLSELGFPQSVRKMAYLNLGLVLVTGPSGCGKSTTLAALINEINENLSRHIITLEDPIEYLHQNKKSRIVQREIGKHTDSFARALKSALREDPDVIMIGELRDLESISLALTAAETGHLVLSTLHTNRAYLVPDRIINTFPPYEQPQVRVMLSEMLKGVISQHLVKREDKKGRVAALEILVWTSALAALIREDKTYRITSLMQTGKAKFGMRLLEDSLLELVGKGIIREESFHEFMREDGLLR